jgi:hypothetical protein
VSYLYAWLLVAGAGILGVLGLFFLTRNVSSPRLRAVLRLLPPVLLLAPAPVPNYDGQFAPAFIVLVFESLFQAEGKPLAAGLILVVAGTTAIAAGLLFGGAGSKRHVAPAEQGDVP